MTEFRELVRIKKRICIKYKSSGCIGCPIESNSNDLCGIISISGYSDNRFMELEEALLSWAAEHQEPEYPTWGEWFVSIGMLPEKWDNLTSAYMNVGCVPNLIHSSIPADIAQKLGIEPKEG